MPIYEYKCGGCGEVFEAFIRSMSDSAAQTCPGCGGRDCPKIFSVFAAQGTQSKASSSGGADCSTCGSRHCSTCGH